jgi:predicted alpha/beta hydrolase family esterase
MKTNVLILPGLYNSGPDHWQTRWEAMHPEFGRVEQTDWETPRCDDWVASLDAAVDEHGADVVLVGHSLACTLVAHWATRTAKRVRGALLVAPSDVEGDNYPPGTQGFRPVPLVRLAFRTIVVASADDIYVSLDRARGFAEAWGSKFVNIGAAGHINTASGLGDWPQGFELLQSLR